MIRKLAALLALCVPLSAYGEVQGPVEDCEGPNRNPGSMLIYPMFDAGLRGFSVHCVTNTNTTPAVFGQPGGTTNVLFEWVNATPGTTPFDVQNCYVIDRQEVLTPADTLCVMSTCVNPAKAQGYLTVTAQDPFKFKTDWSHNYLVGSSMVIAFSGAVFATNAISFRSPLPEGTETDVMPADGLRNLNGFEYNKAADKLILDNAFTFGRPHLTLFNLTGPTTATNTLQFDIWNDNEYPLSQVRAFRCWFDATLDEVSPVFSAGFLANLPNDPGELDLNCDGDDDTETAWALIDSIDVSGQQGNYAFDGVILGGYTGGVSNLIQGGRLLWESTETQDNGAVIWVQ